MVEKLAGFWKELLKQPLKGVLLGTVIFLIGVTLVWPIPAIVLHSNEVAANKSIDVASDALARARITLNEQSLWILPKYLTHADGRELLTSLDQADTNINGKGGARDMMSKCHGSVSEKITCLKNAKLHADLTTESIGVVVAKLTANETLKLNAREEIKNFSAAIVVSQQLEVEAIYAQETPYHRLVYVKPIRDNLDTISSKLTIVEKGVSQAIDVMPPDVNVEQRGDPQLAIDEINHAKTEIDEINTLMTQVTSELERLKTARTDARPTVDEAIGSISVADQAINSINSKYGWGFELALKPAVVSLNESRVQLENARLTLSTMVQPEGKIDWILAYSQAQASLNGALSAKGSADAQVNAYLSTVDKLNRYETVVSSAKQALNSAESAERTLRNNHASDTWSNVSNNIDSARKILDDAENKIVLAKNKIGLTLQQFSDANDVAGESLDLVAQAKLNAEAVTELANSLESYRGQWPGLETKASETIRNEKPGPGSENCAYDANAKSDLAEAKELLNEAQSAANTGYFENACSLAKTAHDTADGVNSRCVRAYNDEMDNRTQVAVAATQAEESRIAAREAAEEAAQEAAQRALEEASRPSPSSVDTGGYQPDYSPSSQSDGGGWNNSSSSSPSDGGGWGD